MPRQLKELNLLDDFLFNKLVSHPEYGEELSRELLRNLFGREFGKLQVVAQKVYYGSDTDTLGARLDVYLEADEENPEGVIFVLRNINNSVNIDNQNSIHPFYMVYIGIDGDIVCDYLNPKKLLDTVRLLCRGKKEPVLSLCRKFNAETDDGRNMQEVSELLNDAINSIIDVKEDSDIDSLFSAGGTSALMSEISGLDDFELICCLVVK